MSINFTGIPVDKTTITKRASIFKNNSIPAYIVELDKNNFEDMNSLHDTAFKWYDNGGRYAPNIYNKAVDKYKFNDISKEHFYALTTQQKDFEKIKPDNILGLMMFSETKNFDNEINYLEVDPATSKSKNLIREYKKVGSRLVEFIKKTYNKKSIFVQADSRAIKFYKKMGFFQLSKDTMERACQMYFRR